MLFLSAHEIAYVALCNWLSSGIYPNSPDETHVKTRHFVVRQSVKLPSESAEAVSAGEVGVAQPEYRFSQSKL